MTLPTHAVWVDANNDPDYEKLGRAGIDAPYFDPRDPRVTASYLSGVKAHIGIATCGIYTAWNMGEWTGAQYAEWTDAQLRRIAWAGNAPVCLDIETHDVGYIVHCLKRWRELRPTRPTWLTLEGMQGGIFDPAAVSAIVQSQVRLAPQFYTGDMGALGHSVVIDLLMAGFPGERIDGMYDAARLPYRWRGFAFTQGRLP